MTFVPRPSAPQATRMSYMFSRCSSLDSLDLSGFDTSSVASMHSTFSVCSSLASLTVGSTYVIKAAEMFPDATADSGMWWSTADSAWYSKDEIVAGRSGVADTYLNYHEKLEQEITAPGSLSVSVGKKASIGATTSGDGALSYRSVDKTIATVSSAGKVTGVAAGSTRITITAEETTSYNKATKKVSVTVRQAQTITAPGSLSVTVGKSKSIGATTTGDGALSYASANTKVAKVSSAGKVTGVRAGSTTVTITAAETESFSKATKKASVTVTGGTSTLPGGAADAVADDELDATEASLADIDAGDETAPAEDGSQGASEDDLSVEDISDGADGLEDLGDDSDSDEGTGGIEDITEDDASVNVSLEDIES